MPNSFKQSLHSDVSQEPHNRHPGLVKCPRSILTMASIDEKVTGFGFTFEAHLLMTWLKVKPQPECRPSLPFDSFLLVVVVIFAAVKSLN